MSITNNIVLNTLLTKVRELEAEDIRIDQEYTKDKKRIRTDLEQLKKAIIFQRDQLSTQEKVEILRSKPGRKPQEFDPNNYPYTGSIKNKILFAINDSNRFLHVREITEYILEREPTIEPTGFSDLIGRHIWKYKSDGVVVAYKVGSSHRNTFYGLPDWLDEFEKPKPEHNYNPKALIDKTYGIEMESDSINDVSKMAKYQSFLFSQRDVITTPPNGGAEITTVNTDK